MANDDDGLGWQLLRKYRRADELRGLKAVLTPELSRCFSPPVHEGQRQPYGVLVARDDSGAKIGALLDIADGDRLRDAADGVNTLVYCTKGQPARLLRLTSRIDSQDECSAMAAMTDGVVARVDANGIIWVVTCEAVTTIDGKGGWTRPSTREVVSLLRELLPDADLRVLNGLARFAYSRLSPNKVGASLLYELTEEDRTDHERGGTDLTGLKLDVQKQDDWPLIEHELRHSDGACVINRAGHVVRKAVFLEPSPAAQATVQTHGGTRHNSACRHTYDRPDLLAFVVSADGPVTLFSDGVPAMSLVLRDRELPWNPSGGEMWADTAYCPNCGSSLVVRKIVLYGFRADEEGHCPICGAEVASVHGWGVEVGLVKDEKTIRAICKVRAG